MYVLVYQYSNFHTISISLYSRIEVHVQHSLTHVVVSSLAVSAVPAGNNILGNGMISNLQSILLSSSWKNYSAATMFWYGIQGIKFTDIMQSVHVSCKRGKQNLSSLY